ncbi:uncharacterized protein LOC123553221 [Mercenaria mercenaria]|uniref:uncharacterized protein LOC123553221 n=1 Tax=Mercenaria mercenaria TaxID=6596 RepID=UPI00234F2F2C|nr:uncharacterized protein LOC123553221 [Mercenaria mercenaria]
MCAWNNHFCWPGRCIDQLTTTCTCAAGFRKVATSGETSCQPTKAPSIVTCHTRLVGQNGADKKTKGYGDVQACSHLKDMYGNFQPAFFQFVMWTTYNVSATNYPMPSYIAEYKLGVADTTVHVKKNFVNGSVVTLGSHPQLATSASSEDVTVEQRDSASISVSSERHSLQYGDSLCLEFEAYAGGYLKSKNLISQTVNNAVPYKKVRSTNTICYIYDNISPRHCREEGTCHTEPLRIERPITRSPFNKVIFTGWKDPIPTDGSTTRVSGIERYTVYVNEVISTKGHLRVDYSTMYIKTLKSTDTDAAIYLKPDKPTLYLVKLEVKDFADNVQQARRFLLYDDVSFIEAREEVPLIVNTASRLSNYSWQTHQTICLSWKDHFLNRFYVGDELLSPIESDQDGLFSGVYEQTTGLLSIYGTPNVYGIIKFLVSVYINGKQHLSAIESPDLQNQSYCRKFSVKDGDECIFMIQPVDIAGNTYTENVTVFIDQSEPEIEFRNLSNLIDRHETIELPSFHKIEFGARDPHSGVRNIVWTFGIANSSTEISTGDMSVYSFSNFHSCQNRTPSCYCPASGSCELYEYTLPENKMNLCDDRVKKASTRNFYVTITVTNNAFLNYTMYVDVLINEAGVKQLCKTNDLPLYAGLSSGISVFLVVFLAFLVVFIVRRRRRNRGTAKNIELESYENLDVCFNSHSNDTHGQQARRKAAKEKKIESYQELDAKALCSGDSYDVITDQPSEDRRTQTLRSTQEDESRGKSNVYEDITPTVALVKTKSPPLLPKRMKVKPNVQEIPTEMHIYENTMLTPIPRS